MFTKNYFKIAARQLMKQKMYSAIKIGGFALGIAACLLIALFIRDELSYDRSYPNADRIYRLAHEYDDNGKAGMSVFCPAPLAGVLKTHFPEVEKSGRIMASPLFEGAGSNQMKKEEGGQSIYEEGFAYADQDVLDIFGIHMVYGDATHALDEPNTMVLSRRKADKYFPGENPVGKIIYLNNNRKNPYKIGGVMDDFPSNSHLQFDFLLTMKGKELWPGEQTYWVTTNYRIYVLLKPGTDIAGFESKLTSINKQYLLPSLTAEGFKDANRMVASNIFHVEPVKSIHLAADRDGLQHGDMRFVWLFGGIAFFILFIACINFINLATAKSASRAREVGLRKVIGSYRIDLIRQFLAESLLFSVLSFALALVVAWLLLPYFNSLTSKSLVFPWTAWWLAPVLLVSSVIVGILAGLYPSFYLSSFKPIQVLKGQLSLGSKNAGLRSFLVVFQFTTSIVLIIGTIIIYTQVQYILHKKTGFDKDQVLLIQGTNAMGEEIRTFKKELQRLPQVRDASIGDYLPIDGTKRDGNYFFKEGRTNIDDHVSGQFWVVDEDYLPTMGMRLVDGRNFSRQMATDTQAIIINQSLATRLNLGDHPVGKRITNGDGIRTVIGVVENFDFETVHGREGIEGVSMILGISPSIVSVKLNSADMKSVIPAITGVWKKFVPDQPIRYTFMDEGFAKMYEDVQRMGKIFTSFAVLAIIIACLGLFALSAFMAEQRSKEIGIRKVLGASIAGITSMMAKDFVRLVFISILIATPVAWWAMSKWLQDFSYRVPISGWVFVAAGGAAILIAILTVSFQSVKAATANPVESLRGEG
ncbi:MAG: ABC transporter permease [Puia sp.]|nr:ABC transporter permease [Puia sp.]